MSARGNPILSIFAIAASLCAPRARADGSLNSTDPAAAGAGDGVAGAFGVVLEPGAGAAGAAGVWEVGAGVDGAADVDVEAAGAAFGYTNCQFLTGADDVMWLYLGCHAYYKALLLNIV